ncbi:MAG TPA: RDD family protein [Burkholderiaceae bacterium]|jgi:uncharacterized RDD family membrane protein YckC
MSESLVSGETPGLARRLAAMTYEGVLLFGVVFIADYLFSALTQQRNAMQGRTAGQAFLFVVLGVYFSWFWSHGGQTVAMKAWHVRVVDAAGRPLTEMRAFARYVLSYLWFVPALAGAWAIDVKGSRIFVCILAGVVTYALMARLHPRRQFLHDLICGTQLITQMPAKTP